MENWGKRLHSSRLMPCTPLHTILFMDFPRPCSTPTMQAHLGALAMSLKTSPSPFMYSPHRLGLFMAGCRYYFSPGLPHTILDYLETWWQDRPQFPFPKYLWEQEKSQRPGSPIAPKPVHPSDSPILIPSAALGLS